MITWLLVVLIGSQRSDLDRARDRRSALMKVSQRSAFLLWPLARLEVAQILEAYPPLRTEEGTSKHLDLGIEGHGVLKRGDRVKLTDAVAETMMRGTAPGRRRPRIDWAGRRGTLVHKSGVQASIRWDDTKYPDIWPLRAVERIEP